MDSSGVFALLVLDEAVDLLFEHSFVSSDTTTIWQDELVSFI
jgi:hypothetical protein